MVQNIAKFHETSLTAIKPRGWLRRYLDHQRDGLTGHIEAAGFPYDTEAWMTPTIKIDGFPSWWPYVLYIYTGNETHLQSSINAYIKIDRHHMLVDGVNSSTEGLHGKDPLERHETCDIADYTWSVGYLLMATGRADYADKIERACFNAAPGAVTHDFAAMQYFSCPNQLIATTSSNHIFFFRGHDWMSYQPDPKVQCCVGELNRIMPNYIARMWMTNNHGGIVAALYGPSQVTATLGNGHQSVTIDEETTYPFSEEIDFILHNSAPVSFPFILRIPGWCQAARLLVNGVPVPDELLSGSFFTLSRVFNDGDRITLILPMHTKTTRWPHAGISLERGPLVYALKVEENWQVVAEETHHIPGFPAYNLYPASPWNYALDLDETDPEKDVEIIYRPYTDDPWNLQSAPLELHVPARRVHRWGLAQHKKIRSFCQGTEGIKKYTLNGQFTFTPQLPLKKSLPRRLAKNVETITLVPYGCTKLRLTIFPYAR